MKIENIDIQATIEKAHALSGRTGIVGGHQIDVRDFDFDYHLAWETVELNRQQPATVQRSEKASQKKERHKATAKTVI